MKGFAFLFALIAIVAAKMSEEETFERVYGRPDPRCPAVDDPHHPVHIPHSTNCDKFYKCYNKRAYLMDCPAGMWWDSKADHCDLKGEHACVIGESEDKIAHVKVVAEKCPSVDDPWNPVHLPHSFECDKFFKCSLGEAIEMNCPASLHWSTELDRCEHPAVAKCAA